MRVGRAIAARVQAQAGLHADDRAAGIAIPLLICLTMAVPDEDGSAILGSGVIGTQALVVVNDNNLANGTPTQPWDCTAGANQTWVYTARKPPLRVAVRVAVSTWR